MTFKMHAQKLSQSGGCPLKGACCGATVAMTAAARPTPWTLAGAMHRHQMILVVGHEHYSCQTLRDSPCPCCKLSSTRISALTAIGARAHVGSHQSQLPILQDMTCEVACAAGKSPLLGSPWPYLMHKRHVKETPAEHAGPTPVPEDREQEDDEVLQCHAPPPARWHLPLQYAVDFPAWSHLKVHPLCSHTLGAHKYCDCSGI
jgi:hypothetical protein